MATPWYQWQGKYLVIMVRVQPGAAKNEIVGLHGDALKIRVQASPTQGKANSQLVAILSQLCGVAKSQVILETGANRRIKRLRILCPRRLPPGVKPMVLPEN